jgi:hypothetical protein
MSPTAEGTPVPQRTDQTSDRRRMTLGAALRGLPSSGRWTVSAILIVLVFFGVVWGLWIAERYLLPALPAAAPPIAPTRPHFWIQVLVGKWVPNSVPYASTSFAFSLSVVLAFVLNLGPFAATITLIYLYIIKPMVRLGKEQAMKVEQYNNQRDLVIIGEIRKLLPPEQRELIMPIVEQAFQNGNQAMEKEFLPIPYGERGAREFFKRLQEIDVT